MLSLLLLLPLALLPLISARAYDRTACNNSPLLCTRRYSDITHLGTHNSPFLRDESTGFSASGNQGYNSTVQLDNGVRLLTAQVQMNGEEVHVCHSSCRLLDAGRFRTWIGGVGEWLERNPSDGECSLLLERRRGRNSNKIPVVSIIITNPSEIPASTLLSQIPQSMLSQAFIPPSPHSWPTLQEMIDLNKRLVLYLAQASSPSIPLLLDQYAYIFETPFEHLSPSAFSCALDRPTTFSTLSDALSAGLIPMANRFVYKDLGFGILAPDVENILNTNSPNTLGRSLLPCNETWGRKPGFVVVDFWSEGNARDVVDGLNGVRVVVNRKEVPVKGAGSAGVKVRVGVGMAGVLAGVLGLGMAMM